MAISVKLVHRPRRPGDPWTVKELADAARVSDQCVYNWLHTRAVKSLDLPGGAKRIPDSEARRLLGLDEEAAA